MMLEDISFPCKKNTILCSFLLQLIVINDHKIKEKKKANEVVFRILSLLARSGHVAEMLIQVAHIRSSGMAQPLGKLRSFSPTDNCDCLDSNLPRNASHRWRERDKETERERERERRLD